MLGLPLSRNFVLVLKCAHVILACIVASAADNQANERKLGPPVKPKKRCKCHGANPKHKMHAHVNCFLGEFLISLKLSAGAKISFEWFFCNPAEVETSDVEERSELRRKYQS